MAKRDRNTPQFALSTHWVTQLVVMSLARDLYGRTCAPRRASAHKQKYVKKMHFLMAPELFHHQNSPVDDAVVSFNQV